MTREELCFEAYVVLGNVLHLLVNGVKAEDQQRLHQLPAADRALLRVAVETCEWLAETQAEHLIGASADVRGAITQMLLQPAMD